MESVPSKNIREDLVYSKECYKIIAEKLYNVIKTDLLPTIKIMYKMGYDKHTDKETNEFLKEYDKLIEDIETVLIK